MEISAFLSQFKVSCRNRHFKSILSQIRVFRVVRACVVAKTLFLTQFEVSRENRHLKSSLTQISTFVVVKALYSH